MSKKKGFGGITGLAENKDFLTSQLRADGFQKIAASKSYAADESEKRKQAYKKTLYAFLTIIIPYFFTFFIGENQANVLLALIAVNAGYHFCSDFLLVLSVFIFGWLFPYAKDQDMMIIKFFFFSGAVLRILDNYTLLDEPEEEPINLDSASFLVMLLRPFELCYKLPFKLLDIFFALLERFDPDKLFPNLIYLMIYWGAASLTLSGTAKLFFMFAGLLPFILLFTPWPSYQFTTVLIVILAACVSNIWLLVFPFTYYMLTKFSEAPDDKSLLHNWLVSLFGNFLLKPPYLRHRFKKRTSLLE